jgi:hypothetical protein
VRRLWKWAVLVVIYAYLTMLLRDDIATPGEAITRAPEVLLDLLPIILQFAFYGALVMFQFVAIFWFLSRGGIDIVFPEDIETRFEKVWGQDHVLSHIKENIAFLEKPDEIEAKGGYIPGGILLWGPPGTGKTLIAEAIAGEVGKPFVFVDPGAFIQMFFGVGILKVKRLFRKLRKLSIKHGGVVVFFDEADSLGSRGMSLGGTPPAEGVLGSYLTSCNGFSYLSPATQHTLLDELGANPDSTAAPRSGLVNRLMMGGGMGGGGMGTLGFAHRDLRLTKPGLGNRIRRIWDEAEGRKYRISHDGHQHAGGPTPPCSAPGASTAWHVPLQGRACAPSRAICPRCATPSPRSRWTGWRSPLPTSLERRSKTWSTRP